MRPAKPASWGSSWCSCERPPECVLEAGARQAAAPGVADADVAALVVDDDVDVGVVRLDRGDHRLGELGVDAADHRPHHLRVCVVMAILPRLVGLEAVVVALPSWGMPTTDLVGLHLHRELVELAARWG